MESIRSRFFNGVENNEKKMSWVRWKSVLASKEKGSLGVLSFYVLNRALLFKWVWRFRNDNRSLWARVIQAVHGEDGSLSNSPKSSRASIWLDIVRDLTHIKKQGIDLLGLIKKNVGNGKDTLFWEDVWKGNVALKLLYPRVYELESFKKIIVAAELAHDNLGYSLRHYLRGGAEFEQWISSPFNVRIVACLQNLQAIISFHVIWREIFVVKLLPGGILVCWSLVRKRNG
ncbi:hypothetical protein Tco_1461484 [Tanacetum coccineum]